MNSANRLDYEISLLDNNLSESEYAVKLAQIKQDISGDIAVSLLASLPREVSSALEEIGKIDLYSLVVGSIFYKLTKLPMEIKDRTIALLIDSDNVSAKYFSIILDELSQYGKVTYRRLYAILQTRKLTDGSKGVDQSLFAFFCGNVYLAQIA